MKERNFATKPWEEWARLRLIIWQTERREVLPEEANGQWKQREAEYERRWDGNHHNTIG